MRISDWSSACALPIFEADHRGELLRIELLGVALRDQRIGIGRVADHQHLDVAAGLFRQRLALHREDLGVGFEQILALPAGAARTRADQQCVIGRSEEHTSELQSLMRISYAVFCLKKKKKTEKNVHKSSMKQSL